MQPSATAGVSAEPLDRAADASAAGELPGTHTPSYEEIAEAAYHRFLRRGGRDGRDLDDWIEAERELRTARRHSGS